ncbi:hypothetical protein Q8F55_006840 [Vanrija albida]|uniref:Uncharacterized protein n=1 Tax=Vanrija albida TaxID=181172 RepID=A0ABR3PZ09_9TREE
MVPRIWIPRPSFRSSPCMADQEALGSRSAAGPLATIPTFCSEELAHSSWGIRGDNPGAVGVLRAVITLYEDQSIEIYKHSDRTSEDTPPAPQSLIAHGPDRRITFVDVHPAPLEAPGYVGFLKNWNEIRCRVTHTMPGYAAFRDDDSHDTFDDDPSEALCSKGPYTYPPISSVADLLRLGAEWAASPETFWGRHSFGRLARVPGAASGVTRHRIVAGPDDWATTASSAVDDAGGEESPQAQSGRRGPHPRQTARVPHAVRTCNPGPRTRTTFRPAPLPGVNRSGAWRSEYDGGVVAYRDWGLDARRGDAVGAIVTVYADGSMEEDADGAGSGWIYPDLRDRTARYHVPIAPHVVPPYILFLLAWNRRRCADLGAPPSGADAALIRAVTGQRLVRPLDVHTWNQLNRLTRLWLEDRAAFWQKHSWHNLAEALLSQGVPGRRP